MDSLVGDIPTLSYDGIRLKNKSIGEHELYGKPGFEIEETTLVAVPYCMWNNRGTGEMLVWQKVRI